MNVFVTYRHDNYLRSYSSMSPLSPFSPFVGITQSPSMASPISILLSRLGNIFRSGEKLLPLYKSCGFFFPPRTARSIVAIHHMDHRDPIDVWVPTITLVDDDDDCSGASPASCVVVPLSFLVRTVVVVVFFAKDFNKSPPIKSDIPAACSGVQRFSSKTAKLKKSVVALRPVDVNAMDNAPNRLVMAPKQDAPIMPVVPNNTKRNAFCVAVIVVVVVVRDSISGTVPSWSKKESMPSNSSLRRKAATIVAMRDTR